MNSWQDISQEDVKLATTGQHALLIGSWLLGLLAMASMAVVVGGRMAEQTRRGGLLKAVGGTPGLVAAVLLTEYLAVALLAAGAGLLTGWLTAPLLTSPGAGLVGAAGTPPMTVATVGLVLAVALMVTVAATFFPAVRARHAPARSARWPTRPAGPAPGLADRDLGAPARPAAARRADGRPAATSHRTECGQYRHHDHHDRHRAVGPCP